jgi:hypothetical protein
MSKKITGAEFPLAKVFSSDFDYAIPPYQRPYAWTVDEASELFDDLYDFYRNEPDDTYFLGSIVLIKEEGKPLSEVIDGQQRLTTLTILLAAMGHLASGSNRESLRKYICEPGDEIEERESRPRLSLRERDRDFFSEHIQGMDLEVLLQLDPAQLMNDAQKNIFTNAKLLVERVKAAVDEQADFILKFASFLVQRCFLVVVTTPNQQSAFRVFSVLNSRGLDLLPTDIIKSEVIGKISEKDRIKYTDLWEELEDSTGRNGFAELFGHIRMIFAKEKARRALLDEFRTHVILATPNPKDLVAKIIEPYAEAYLDAKKSQYASTAHADEINNLLRWLNRIDNSDWLPPAIAFLAEKKSDPAYVVWFIRKLERLAAFLHISGKDVNERIERYAMVLTALETDHSLQDPVAAVDLSDDEKMEMRSVIDGEIYTLSARRRNHLLLRLDSFLSDGGAIYDPSLLTIEHVLPQTVDSESQWAEQWPDSGIREHWLHRLANLVPLNRKRNSAAQNYDFDKKKQAYFAGRQGVSSYVLTTHVLNTPQWTPEAVHTRQEMLLGVLAEKWEL